MVRVASLASGTSFVVCSVVVGVLPAAVWCVGAAVALIVHHQTQGRVGRGRRPGPPATGHALHDDEGGDAQVVGHANQDVSTMVMGRTRGRGPR